MTMKSIALTLLLAGSLFATITLAADADSTSYSFGDWQVNCAPQENGDQVCLMNQRGLDGKSGQVIYRLGLRYLEKDSQPKFEIVTPLGVRLPDGLQILVDEKQVAEIQYHSCLAQGCIAQSELEKSLETAFRKGEAGKLQMSAAAGQKLALPFSLKGFSDALDKLKKESK